MAGEPCARTYVPGAPASWRPLRRRGRLALGAPRRPFPRHASFHPPQTTGEGANTPAGRDVELKITGKRSEGDLALKAEGKEAGKRKEAARRDTALDRGRKCGEGERDVGDGGEGGRAGFLQRCVASGAPLRCLSCGPRRRPAAMAALIQRAATGFSIPDPEVQALHGERSLSTPPPASSPGADVEAGTWVHATRKTAGRLQKSPTQ